MRSGLYVTFSEHINVARNIEMHRLARSLLAAPPPGVTDVIAGYTNLFVEYESHLISRTKLRRYLERGREGMGSDVHVQQHDIPVRYDGVDLQELAAWADLSADEVVHRHAHRVYHVYAMGFTPGYPFMGEVDEALRKPRHSVPRMRVPAHSVAIANSQTGIYPVSSPGGWNVIGTSLRAVYDPTRERPFLIAPGDRVTFVPNMGQTPSDPPARELLPHEPRRPAFLVREPGLQDLILDQGRPMVGSFGLARTGVADPLMARLANQLVSNQPNDPVIEMTLRGPTLEVLRPCVIAVAGWSLQLLVDGSPRQNFTSLGVHEGQCISFRTSSRGCRSYLAVAGAFQAERHLGSVSVDQRGRIGRPLKEDDVLGVEAARVVRPGRTFVPYDPEHSPVRARVLPGPQYEPEVVDALTIDSYTVASADRVGLRLQGATLTGGGVTSEAVPLGAIQITSGGNPIILLNDRGTVGGYNKPAIVHPRDLRRIAQLREGQRVKFEFYGFAPA